ncbi:MAG: DMT family transporter [Oscillospiraceae bacterium]|nr:DMT family transporter [Oscillospiraceae bacterium]MDO5138826.1 DMT family transporter [Oscillospiraceae bacterium]
MRKKGIICLLIAAVCWGAGYIAQSFGLKHIQPFAMTCGRYIVATLILLPLALRSVPLSGEGKSIWKRCAYTGFLCGLPMAVSMILQSMGLAETTAGKGAFISSLYIVFTPVLGVLLRKKVRAQIWVAVAIALVGSYFLCVTGDFTLARGDILIFLCAISFAVQNHVIEGVGDNGYPLVHSLFTEMTVCVTSLVLMIIAGDIPTTTQLAGAILPILFAGVVAGSVADTCALMGQTLVGAQLASVLMGLESVFGAIFGVLFLKETLTIREVFGCILIFIGVLVAQYEKKETV